MRPRGRADGHPACHHSTAIQGGGTRVRGKPTGKQVTVSGLTISRLSDDKIVEEFQNWDTLGMLQQLGAVPALAHA
ncbi:MAG TPA: ester cyclase [Gaiellaceae bacterium]